MNRSVTSLRASVHHSRLRTVGLVAGALVVVVVVVLLAVVLLAATHLTGGPAAEAGTTVTPSERAGLATRQPPVTQTVTAPPVTHVLTERIPYAVSGPAPAEFSYASCDAAWDAGAAPIRFFEYGYGLHLDPDRNGTACERPS